MNRLLKGLFALSLVVGFTAYGCNPCNTDTCNTCCCDCNSCCLGACDGYPYMQMRSQGRDAARELVGWQQFVNKYDMDTTYGALTAAVEYSQSFWNQRLANFLFGSDLCCGSLLVQGSAVANRNSNARLADYFGLPTDFSSCVTFCPKIQNVVADFNFYLGLDELAEGLFMRINLPVAWTKWQLCPCETFSTRGSTGFDAGYMASTTVDDADLNTSFLGVMNGCGKKFGDMQTSMKFGLINPSCCDCTKAGVAEIDLELGWNFVLEEDYHFGLSLYVAAPTGNKPCATRLFEPMIGNGKHWELGGGVSGSWIFWRGEEQKDRYLGIWLEGTIAHLFNVCQCRSFDFCCKPNSRYMLLEEMGTNDDVIQGEVSGSNTTADYQYKGNLIPAINWSTLNVKVSIPVMGDVALKLGYVRDNWNFDLGYNLYARSGEKFCNDCCNTCNTDTRYAIKGDTWLYGANAADTKFALSATQSLADIHSGKNYPAQNSDNPKTNPRIDLPYNADVSGANLYVIGAPATRILTSIQPVLVNKGMLNLGKSPSQITNAIFANLNYAWKDREGDWTPFLGVGGKAEFSVDSCTCCNNNCGSCCNTNCGTCCTTGCGSCCNTYCGSSCNSSCNTCNSCCTKRGGVSQWGVWAKGGVAF